MKRSALVIAGAVSLVLPGAVAAQVAFRDHCAGYSLVMHPDGSERTPLPLVEGARPLDVSRGSSPLTVLLNGLYAVAVYPDGTGGFLVDTPFPLLQPGEAPRGSSYASFSATGDRIAYSDGYFEYLYVGDVVRDATGRVIDLTNITEVVNLKTLGNPSDTSSSTAFTGQIDFSPDGTRVAAVIYDDVWILTLGEDGHTLVSAAALTRTCDFAERNPRWSPAGNLLAITGGSYQGGVLYHAGQWIYTLDVSTGTRTQVVTKKNAGSAGAGKDDANWSPDGTTLIFAAYGPSAPRKRNSPCYAVNYDLFRIASDGSSTAVNVTATVGTSIEAFPRWGWE